MGIGTQSPIDNLLPLLQRVRPRPGHDGEFTASCPCARHVRGDQDPSLSIAVCNDGKLLLKCFSGGCTAQEIMTALGKTTADLFPNAARNGTPKKKGKSYTSPPKAIAAIGRGISYEHPGAMFAGSWDYYGAAGNVIFVVARWNLPGDDGRKTFRPIHREAQVWRIGDPPGKLPLYRLNELLAADRSAVMHVTEGEGKAEILASLGLLATTSAHGSKSAAKTDWTPLAGWAVELHPDADGAGEAYVFEVAMILRGLNPPARVKIVRLPGLKQGSGDDIKEWIARRREDGKDDDAIRTEIEDLAHPAPEVIPETNKPIESPRTAFVVDVILNHLRMKYQPIFRQGATIFSHTFSRYVSRSEVAPDTKLIGELLLAADYPHSKQGPDRSSAPAVFRNWFPTAWQDLLDTLEDESESGEIAESACEIFRSNVADLLRQMVTLGEVRRDGEPRTVTERRPLYRWAERFAKPSKHFQDVRQMDLFSRKDPKTGELFIAFGRGLYAQVGRTAPAGERTFPTLALNYGVGTRGRKNRGRYIVLSREFMEELFSRPGDATGDDDGDGLHARARDASASPSPVSSPDGGGNGQTVEPH